MKRTIVILLILIIVFLAGCSHQTVKSMDNFISEQKIMDKSGAEELSFSINEVEYFDEIISTYYQMPNLEEYNFYKIEDVLYANYYFFKRGKDRCH